MVYVRARVTVLVIVSLKTGNNTYRNVVHLDTDLVSLVNRQTHTRV